VNPDDDPWCWLSVIGPIEEATRGTAEALGRPLTREEWLVIAYMVVDGMAAEDERIHAMPPYLH